MHVNIHAWSIYFIRIIIFFPKLCRIILISIYGEEYPDGGSIERIILSRTLSFELRGRTRGTKPTAQRFITYCKLGLAPVNRQLLEFLNWNLNLLQFIFGNTFLLKSKSRVKIVISSSEHDGLTSSAGPVKTVPGKAFSGIEKLKEFELTVDLRAVF